MHAMHASSPHEWTRRTLTTIGEACRAVKGELLERLVDWIVDKLNDDWSMSQIKAVLARDRVEGKMQNSSSMKGQEKRTR